MGVGVCLDVDTASGRAAGRPLLLRAPHWLRGAEAQLNHTVRTRNLKRVLPTGQRSRFASQAP